MIGHHVELDVLAGSVAGFSSTLVCYPFDLIRTRMQTTTVGKFQGSLHCFLRTVQFEGWLALFKGMTLPLGAQMAYKAIIFTTNEEMRRLLGRGDRQFGRRDYFICGAVGGAVRTIVATPVELVAKQIMVQYSPNLPRYQRVVDCIRSLISTHGPSILWRGLLLTLCRDGLGMGLYFVAMEEIMRLRGGERNLSDTLIAGSAAGIAFWSIALPFDTLSSVVQTNIPMRRPTRQVVGIDSLCQSREFIRQRGIRSLFRGAPVAFGRGIPSAAITITMYHHTREILKP